MIIDSNVNIAQSAGLHLSHFVVVVVFVCVLLFFSRGGWGGGELTSH